VRRALLAVAVLVAGLVSGVAAAGEPEHEPLEPARVTIALGGSRILCAMVRDAVASMVPHAERITWIDETAAEADLLDPSERPPQIRIDIPAVGRAEVIAYQDQAPPVVRFVDDGRPPAVIVESVAQIVGEAVRALRLDTPAARTPRRATDDDAEQPAALAPPTLVAARPSPGWLARGWPSRSLAIGLLYVQRSIMDSGALGGTPVPSQRGASIFSALSVPAGRLRVIGSFALDFASASVDAPASESFRVIIDIRRYQGSAMLGLGWQLHRAVLVGAAAGGAIEIASYGGYGDRITEGHTVGKASLSASVALPPFARGLELVGALTLDLRSAEKFNEPVLEQGAAYPYFSTATTNRVQPGFSVGLAWRI